LIAAEVVVLSGAEVLDEEEEDVVGIGVGVGVSSLLSSLLLSLLLLLLLL
jgi:hypothetical protein